MKNIIKEDGWLDANKQINQFYFINSQTGKFQMLKRYFNISVHLYRTYLYKHSLMYISLNIYMLALTGQTAGPNRLNFFLETHGCPGSKTA